LFDIPQRNFQITAESAYCDRGKCSYLGNTVQSTNCDHSKWHPSVNIIKFSKFSKDSLAFFKAVHIKSLIGECYHLHSVIRYCLAQSDHIKRCILTCQFSIDCSALLQVAPICLFSQDTVRDPNSSY
jgi:hypothetical protein